MLDSKCFQPATSLFQIPEFCFNSSAPAHLLQGGWIQADSRVGGGGSTKDLGGNLIWSECVKSSDGLILFLLSQRAQRSCINKSARPSEAQLDKEQSRVWCCLNWCDLSESEQCGSEAEYESWSRGVCRLCKAALSWLEQHLCLLSGVLFSLTARFSPLLFCLPVIRVPVWLCSVLFSDN